MANTTLLESPEEMRQTASAVETLKEDFEGLRTSLKTAIQDELRSACAGQVADEFSKYYEEKIDTQLVAERDRLENVIQTLRNTADRFEDTEHTVMSSF